MLTGVSALVAGAISMAAGEYVSVSSQADTERADLAKEEYELANNPERELAELAGIYRQRGLTPELAQQVAEQLTAHNALDAHARDEIGITETASANPLQASGASALAFCCGAILPLLVALFTPSAQLMTVLAGTTLIGLAILGFLSAKLGGARILPAVMRVLIWGSVALASTAFIGKLLGVNVA